MFLPDRLLPVRVIKVTPCLGLDFEVLRLLEVEKTVCIVVT
jgi:hypothetical protein